MKLGLFSDIHLEHREPEDASAILRRIIESAREQGVDFLVNAGDTHDEFDVQYVVAKAAVSAVPLSKQAPYLAVQGNHDYYYDDWRDDQIECIWFSNGLKLLSGTMWTDFNHDPMCEFQSNMCISDFRAIGGVSSGRMMDQFKRFRETVEDEKPDVVVSHFAPSPGSIVEQWRGHALNGYFCPDMLGQLEHWPRLWLHGHIHNPVDYVIDKKRHYPHWDKSCRVVANPLGYPGETYKDVADYSVKVIEVLA